LCRTRPGGTNGDKRAANVAEKGNGHRAACGVTEPFTSMIVRAEANAERPAWARGLKRRVADAADQKDGTARANIC